MSETAHKPKRQRSPSYPAIDLAAALERARELYSYEGRNIAPNTAITGHWGYSDKSGPGFGTLGALKRFGLLRGEGPGKSRLSDLALQIILDEREDSAEREEAVKTAALAPSIHREIWDKYPQGLPSDATLRHFLRLDKGFTDAAADELIREFRSTLAFANLVPGDSLSSDAEDNGAEVGQAAGMSAVLNPPPRTGEQTHSAVVPPGQRAVPIPLSATEWVTLQGGFPLSPEAWDQLMRVLEVMKPGLVAPPLVANADED